MTESKRRLEMMPEVLPAPTPLDTKSNVRARTLSHMRHLLAGVAALPAASCTKSDTQSTQTVTIPVTSSSASAQNPVEGSLLPHPTATATATPTATAPDMGYAVVDPMPMPARCAGLAGVSHTTAAFKRDATGIVLEVSVTLPASWAGPSSPNTHATFDPSAKPQAWSSTLVSSTIHGSTATARLRVTAGNTNAGLSFTVDCGAPNGTGQLSVNAIFTANPTETTKVTVTTHDY